jgi:hypothetical protein
MHLRPALALHITRRRRGALEPIRTRLPGRTQYIVSDVLFAAEVEHAVGGRLAVDEFTDVAGDTKGADADEIVADGYDVGGGGVGYEDYAPSCGERDCMGSEWGEECLKELLDEREVWRGVGTGGREGG